MSNPKGSPGQAKLNPNKAQGFDQVTPRVLKELSKQLAMPLTVSVLSLINH